MKLKEAQEKIIRLCNIPFSELFNEDDFDLIIKNKGKTGQLLELALGKNLDSANLDFEDGELKSNKCDANGKPLETVFITQIATVIDELIDEKPFEQTHLYEKINNILYVPVCKVGDPHDWMFLDAIHIDLTNYVLLNKLMYALFVSSDSDGNIPEWKENMQKNDAEITALGERIMKYCPDQDIRLEATARLAFNHCEMGRIDTARAIYDTLPPQKYCKENQIWWSIPEEKSLKFLRDKIKQDYDSLISSVWLLASSGYLSPEESIKAFNKVFEIKRIAYDSEKTPDMWGAARIPIEIAEKYALIGDTEKAIEYLNIGAKAAKAFDERPDEQRFSSLLLGEIVSKRTDFETSDTRTLCEIMRDKWLVNDYCFDNIKNNEQFHNIINTLSQ